MSSKPTRLTLALTASAFLVASVVLGSLASRGRSQGPLSAAVSIETKVPPRSQPVRKVRASPGVSTATPAPSERASLAASAPSGLMFQRPWYDWIEQAECIVEARLSEAYAERYNTDSGAPPYGSDPDTYEWLYGWRSYIPLRFDVESIIWGSCDFDGFVTFQLRQRHAWPTTTPPPDSVAGKYAAWWVSPETLMAQPLGLAAVKLGVEPPPVASPNSWDLPYPDEAAERYMAEFARDLSQGDSTYVWVRLPDWYEYVDDTAVCLAVSRQLPVPDLLSEVHSGLRLLGRE